MNNESSFSMETFLHAAKGPVSSILGSLVARCLTLRVKSNLSRGETITRPAVASLGVMVAKEKLSLVVKTIVHATLANMDVERLRVVLVGQESAFEQVVSERLLIVCDDGASPLDALVDFDSFLSWGSVAEIQSTMSQWLRRMRPGAPILLLTPRYERILACADDPGPLVEVSGLA
jgi:hypothetical protein